MTHAVHACVTLDAVRREGSCGDDVVEVDGRELDLSRGVDVVSNAPAAGANEAYPSSDANRVAAQLSCARTAAPRRARVLGTPKAAPVPSLTDADAVITESVALASELSLIHI